MPDPDQLDEWKQAIDLQKHFNDILLRLRGLAFTFGGVAVAFLVVRPGGPPAPEARWLGLAAPWLALYLMDRLYYHELLRAVVRVAEEVEKAGKAPRISTVVTAWNRRTGRGSLKVSLFYALPLAGIAWAFSGDWRLALWALVPAVAVEVYAWSRHLGPDPLPKG
jgi:hypothetical protein